LTAAALASSLLSSPLGAATCLPADAASSVEQIVARVRAEQRRYVFVGENHRVGPVKKFVVDLTNALVDSGYDVGLYVEGFRTDCPPRDNQCASLARLFNRQAFQTLLDQSKAPVHAIDPPQRAGRVARMAAMIAEGTESVRVVLAGQTHVLHAGDGGADIRVFGGGLRYPDPGDLAEAFVRSEYLTVGLETADSASAEYSLREGGCGADYLVTTPRTGDYWVTLADSGKADPPTPAVPADQWPLSTRRWLADAPAANPTAAQ
jgi:hypothetical protein